LAAHIVYSMEITEVKKTALYDTHSGLGAKLIPFAGFDMPVRYTGDKEEHLTVRNAAGVFDVSHMGEFFVKGPRALELIQKVTTNDASKLFDGKAQYSCMPNLTGGIVDDLIVYRIADAHYMLVVNASNIEKDWNWIVANNSGIGADLRNASEDFELLALSGPKATEILQKLTSAPVGDLVTYGFLFGEVAGIPNTLVATTGYTGERTYEIFVAPNQAKRLWDALFEAGTPLGLKPTGLGARDTLRLEMGYMLYGNDINDTTSPLEAGLGWITKFQKGDFNGKDLMLQLKANGLQRKLVGFTIEGKGIPRGHYPIAHNGVVVGEVTSGSISPVTGVGIGMGYVPAALAAPGTMIDIMIRDKANPAKVVNPPFIPR
jgi:aminomethyltransferase